MKYLVMTLLGIALLASTTACNTVQGMGKDISATGEAIGDGASNVKQKISK